MGVSGYFQQFSKSLPSSPEIDFNKVELSVPFWLDVDTFY